MDQFRTLAETQKTLKQAADSLGCSLKGLRHNQSARAGDLIIRRKSAPGAVQMQISTPAQERGMVLGMSLLSGHRRRICEGLHRRDRIFDKNAIYIRDFDVDYGATIEGAFDFLLIELPHDARITLRPTHDAIDPVLGQMTKALLPWLERYDGSSPLEADEIGTGLMAHLAAAHAVRRRVRLRAGLSPQQLARAKELLMSVDFEELRLADVAAAVNMSRNSFFRGFRATAGLSPYQWLLTQRLEQAQLLLRLTELPLVDIALSCGFADQSHFTRLFKRAQGLSPGRWRKLC